MSKDIPFTTSNYYPFTDKWFQLKIKHTHYGRPHESTWSFFNSLPVEPFIETGEIWHTGWDISSNYLIDAKKQCWIDDAHGPSLRQVNHKLFIMSFEDDEVRLRIKKLLDLPVEIIECPHCQGTGKIEN